MTGPELKQARAALGMTQKQLSQAINTPIRTIQDWEAGRRRIPGIVYVAIQQLIRDEINDYKQ